MGHMRVLGNTNLAVRGPLTLDADPFSFTQGEILAADQGELTLDVRIFDGYLLPRAPNRVEFFTPEGVMLPHGQDVVQASPLYLSQPHPVFPVRQTLNVQGCA